MATKKTSLREKTENLVESGMFASRWLMAPIYIILCFSLAIITFKVLQHFALHIPEIGSMKLKQVLLFVLQIVDMALIGNLILMIIFAGYENFVSKIDVAKNSPDKPSWMGRVDFSGLKLKLVASIVAISGINLLEAFMSIGYKNELGEFIVSDREIQWMIIVHIIFIISGVLLALMDFIASKTINK
tara:strand:- start:3 stop:563 length:561 start_codon:yes stop_codon:yes gene_type:complete